MAALMYGSAFETLSEMSRVGNAWSMRSSWDLTPELASRRRGIDFSSRASIGSGKDLL